MALSTIGSIATHIVENFTDVPLGVSGNMVEIVDMARQDVSNFVGATIGSNSIDAIYQPAVLNFSNANVIDLIAQGEKEQISLGELSVGESSNDLTASQYRKLGEMSLNSIGRKARFSRSVS